MTLTPYDAIMFVSYGGPDGPDDVLPFMRNATRGRGVPDERLVEVSGHYRLFGGKSPINERNAELMAALTGRLRDLGINIPVVIGNRNWHPFFAETLAELKRSGARRVLCLITSAYASYSGCRQYREDLARALDEIGGGLQLDKIGPFAETGGFIAANAAAVREALERLPGAHLLFVTHSIPTAMNEASGGDLGSYVAQHERVIAEVMASLGAEAPSHELVYCSRSGAPHIPWLEPDVNDRLTELAAQGVKRVIAVPIGFVNDHMEVVYDLDTEANETAAEQGIDYLRAATAGVHPELIASLVEAILARAEAARSGEGADDQSRYVCPQTCCLPRPGACPQPAIA
ncbi:MAG: ferrochelatase [Propionibacteriaceae bacterium]|nr:ferrochelatase [Propionibacteriaceae bacterium]